MLRRYGVWFVVACVLLLGWGAAGAATPKRATFKVTLTGTLTKDWTTTRASEGECGEVVRNVGHWRLTLATRASTRVVAVAPSGRGRAIRFSPGIVRGIAGTATQDGNIRIQNRGDRCGASVQTTNCARQRASVRGATARFSSPTRQTARFSRLQGVRAARSFRANCPEEPEDIRALRTDLTLADGPISVSDVFDRDVPKFFISGNTEQETTIEGEYDGTVTERVRWTLTFTRVG